MKRLLFQLICLLTSFVACSQAGYDILYATTVEELPAFMRSSDHKPVPGYSRLVFNDSASYYYFFPYRKDPMKENIEYGPKVLHHSQICDLREQISYGGVAYQLPEKKRYYVSYPLRVIEWTYQDESKTILGYQCKKALITSIGWVKADTLYRSYTDSTIAWYAEQIKLPFGPANYYGLPGVVLEAYDQRLWGRHIIAEKIVAKPVSILIPETIDVVPVSGTEHGKRRK
ncbi:MAG: GLPGLI family protein [Bacteroidota bacterium]